MCSITGCIIFTGARTQADLGRIEQRIRDLIIRAEDRGRDSYGIASLNRDGSVVELKSVGKPSDSLRTKSHFISEQTTIVINNDRAEPTTEYVRNKTELDIQPFGRQVYVSHNGIIANDHDLEARYQLKRISKIDSAILPPLLERLWDGSTDSLRKILRDEIVGSFALAIVTKADPSSLYLACNYKPLFIEYDRELNVLYFTSLESYLNQQEIEPWKSNVVKQLEPYSLLKINTTKHAERLSLWRDQKMRKALVVCSAGLDSTVAAKVMIDDGYDVTLLHFKYRHRAESREADCLKNIAANLECKYLIVDTSLFKDVIGHSRLTETESPIVTDREGEMGAEFAHEWVPARNLIFLSIATAIAEGHGFETVVLGNNLEESGAYPDNEMIFIDKLNQVLPYATNFQRRVQIKMPVGNLMKHEIVKLGLTNGTPFELTWSCYEGGLYHCGRCGPCYMRKKAFEINGKKDPLTYEARYESSSER